MHRLSYPGGEDTWLLKEAVMARKLTGVRLLEVGTGRGWVATAAAGAGAEVVATDRNPDAIEEAERRAADQGVDVDFKRSDLFDEVEQSFDLVVFNPPYLPGERQGGSDALIGGRKGEEVAVRFLKEVEDYLNEGGEALVVVSSRSDTDALQSFELEKVAEKKLWFESLYVLKFPG
jgi:release factor glutamine methyltransferase